MTQVEQAKERVAQAQAEREAAALAKEQARDAKRRERRHKMAALGVKWDVAKGNDR